VFCSLADLIAPNSLKLGSKHKQAALMQGDFGANRSSAGVVLSPNVLQVRSRVWQQITNYPPLGMLPMSLGGLEISEKKPFFFLEVGLRLEVVQQRQFRLALW